MGEVERGGLAVETKMAHCVLDCLYFLESVLKKSSPTSVVPTGMHLSHLSLCFALEFSVEIQKLGSAYFSRGFYFAKLKNMR